MGNNMGWACVEDTWQTEAGRSRKGKQQYTTHHGVTGVIDVKGAVVTDVNVTVKCKKESCINTFDPFCNGPDFTTVSGKRSWQSGGKTVNCTRQSSMAACHTCMNPYVTGADKVISDRQVQGTSCYVIINTETSSVPQKGAFYPCSTEPQSFFDGLGFAIFMLVMAVLSIFCWALWWCPIDGGTLGESPLYMYPVITLWTIVCFPLAMVCMLAHSCDKLCFNREADPDSQWWKYFVCCFYYDENTPADQHGAEVVPDSYWERLAMWAQTDLTQEGSLPDIEEERTRRQEKVKDIATQYIHKASAGYCLDCVCACCASGPPVSPGEGEERRFSPLVRQLAQTGRLLHVGPPEEEAPPGLLSTEASPIDDGLEGIVTSGITPLEGIATEMCWKARQNKTEAGPPTPQGVEWAFLH